MNPFFSQGHACIIGAGGDLPITAKDAEGLASLLTDPERCAYRPEQVQVLTDAQASRNAVLAALDTLAATTTADATVIVYFSGHGYQVSHPLMGDRYFLFPHGYDPNALAQTAISGEEWATKLRAIPAQKLLLLLDCCHAGGLGDLADPTLAIEKAPLPPEAQALFQKGAGRVVLASSHAQEKSLIIRDRPYSIFTQALLNALRGEGVTQPDGYVRMGDVAMYVGAKVAYWTRDRQHPLLNWVEQADNFRLAYYAGGDTQPKGLAEGEDPPNGFATQDPTPSQSYTSHQTVIQTGKTNFNAGIIVGSVQQGDRTYDSPP